MLLRIISILIIIYISLTLKAAVNETQYHTQKNFRDDIKILKLILKRNPNDLVALKRLLRIHFVVENFQSTIRIASKYLSLKKDKDVAYIKIISLANQKMYKRALKNIDEFLECYNISNDERKLINYKRKIYEKFNDTKSYPKGVKGINLNKDKIFISFLSKGKLVLGYDKSKKKYFSYSYTKGRVNPFDKEPGFLEGIDANALLYFSISTDSRQVLASIKTGVDSSMIKLRKFIIEKKKWSKWSTINQMNPGKWNCYGNFTSDSRSVLYSSNLDKNSGLDIYIISKNYDGEWSKPKKLHNINTHLDEYSLFLHPDGDTLFFSSNGRKGMGGFDIYCTKLIRKNDDYTTSNIINIKELNTYRNENIPLLISKNGKIGFLNLPVANKNYIYEVNNFIFKLPPVSFFEGYVYDNNTKEPIIGAEIKIMRAGAQELRGVLESYTYPDGFIGTTLRQNAKYIISISALDYLYYRKSIYVKSAQESLKKIFYLKKGKVNKGFSFIANNIYFDTGSSKLKDNSFAELHNIYNFLIRNPKITIQISGYTDNVGTYEYNIDLSVQRALSIAHYLEKKGISRNRIIAKGFGYANKAASNLTEKGRQKNRRVEITVIGVK